MKLHYEKTFNGDVSTLPQRSHAPGAVKFREPDDPARMALIANGGAVVLFILTFAGLVLRILHAPTDGAVEFLTPFMLGSVLSLLMFSIGLNIRISPFAALYALRPSKISVP